MRDAGAEETFFTSGAFRRAQVLAQLPDTSILDDFLSAQGIDLDERRNLERVGDIGRRRRRRQEDIGIRQQRQTRQARAQAVLSREQINEQATANAAAIAMELGEIQAPATEAATQTADATTTTSAHAETIAMATGTTAEGTTEISNKLDPIAEINNHNVEILEVLRLSLAQHERASLNLEALVNVSEGGRGARNRLIGDPQGFSAIPDLSERMMLAGAGPTSQSIQSLIINAQNVIVNGANVGGGGDTPLIMIENQTNVELDGDKVGQSVGRRILRQGANRRNLLGERG